MVEGYDAADPDRVSTFALRDEWMGHGLGRQGRIAGGYGALIKFLVSECCRQGASIHLGSAVTAIDENRGRIAACCRDGATLVGRVGSTWRCRCACGSTTIAARACATATSNLAVV
jgi:monoamine oxidase